ncbi:MAG: DUF4112 domain-containing protein [Isosphaeraceae bacterium]
MANEKRPEVVTLKTPPDAEWHRGPIPGPQGSDDLERLAWLMDRLIKIPGTPYTVGLDAILGLLPVGGDVISGFIQTGIVAVAVHRYKVPKTVVAAMATNVAIDTLLGAVPLVGDVFDVTFRANTRNLKLLAEVEDRRRRSLPVETAPSMLFTAGILAGLLALGGLVAVGLITVIGWLWRSLVA